MVADAAATRALSRRPSHGVPERHDEEGADRGEPTRGVPEHVEGALIGPVQVLDDQHRGGSVVEGRDQRRHDQVAVAGLDGGPELRTEARCDVLHRTECSRSGQGVAVAGEHAGPRRHPGVERPYQRRLADTRLTGDEYDGAAPLVGRSSGRGQDAQLLAALQEPPGHPLTTSPASRFRAGLRKWPADPGQDPIGVIEGIGLWPGDVRPGSASGATSTSTPSDDQDDAPCRRSPPGATGWSSRTR